MANHLNLQYTLLEFDTQGNLSIFSNGRTARLLASEVQQWLDWLMMSKDQRSAQLRTVHNVFEFVGEMLVINGVIRIIPMEVQQIGNWIRKRRREESDWLVQPS